MRYVLGIAVAIALLPAAAGASGVLSVTTRKIDTKTSQYEIGIAYPQTGVKTIDDEITAWAKAQAADFIKLAKTARQPDEPVYALDVTYEVARNDASGFAVDFSEETDTGGAHPNHDTATFNYLMPEGWRVFLPEIFDGTKGVARISALTIADLDRQLTGADALSDVDTIKAGAGPNWGNFKDFLLLRDAVKIEFPPYQVASYAAGPQEVRIPLSALREVMRTDWHVPAASFDCENASSPVEHAICSDVVLSRLDRDVSQAYSDKIANDLDDADKATVKTAQRAWLVSRNAVCKDQEGVALVACLTGVYRTRLAALTPEP